MCRVFARPHPQEGRSKQSFKILPLRFNGYLLDALTRIPVSNGTSAWACNGTFHPWACDSFPASPHLLGPPFSRILRARGVALRVARTHVFILPPRYNGYLLDALTRIPASNGTSGAWACNGTMGFKCLEGATNVVLTNQVWSYGGIFFRSSYKSCDCCPFPLYTPWKSFLYTEKKSAGASD